MSDANEKLKPCPFCGGTPYIQPNGRKGHEYWEVVCDTVCDFTGPADNTEAGAIEAWNRRAPSPQPNLRWPSFDDWWLHHLTETDDFTILVCVKKAFEAGRAAPRPREDGA